MVEKGHHKKWLEFRSHRGLRTIPFIRDDFDSNLGINRAGFQREIDIMAAFLLQVFKNMPARGHRTQALPSSAANVVRGVSRIHFKYVPPITMVSFAHATPVLKGMNALYLREHGYRMLRLRWKTSQSSPTTAFVYFLQPSRGSQGVQAQRYKRCAGGSLQLRSRSM